MKIRSIYTLVLIAVLTISSIASAQKQKGTASQVKTLTGHISDASCGLQHMVGMSDRDCTLMCARNGKFVLADRDKKIVYELDDAWQKKASEFAGQKVTVKGRVTGKRVRVTSIEPAS